jgi:hypothetical protein
MNSAKAILGVTALDRYTNELFSGCDMVTQRTDPRICAYLLVLRETYWDCGYGFSGIDLGLNAWLSQHADKMEVEKMREIVKAAMVQGVPT